MPNTFDVAVGDLTRQVDSAVSRERTQQGARFGQSPSSGSATAGTDGPTIGAAASIVVDAITERESGVTPPPPPVSVRAVVIALVAMLVLGLLLILVLTRVFGVPLTVDG
jgi:hypothetical protein